MNIFIIASAAFLNGQYQFAYLEHKPFGSIYQFTTSEHCEAKLDEFFKSGIAFDPEKNMNYEFLLSEYGRRILSVIGSPHGGSAMQQYNLNCKEITLGD
jgi:hypothetical protein